MMPIRLMLGITHKYTIVLALIASSYNSMGQPKKQTVDNSTSSPQPFIVSRTDGCSVPYLHPYSPKHIALLNELPDTIRVKVENYLKTYLGVEFAKTLRFNGANMVNLSELYLTRPEARDFKWKVGTYYLCFDCPTLKSRTGKYSAGITLDANGNVITGINLPSIAEDNDKSKLISIDQAVKIARNKWPERQNVNWIKKSSVTLVYSPQANSLVWFFGQTKSERPGLSHMRRIFIDANNGSVLRIRDTRHHYIPF